MEDINPDMEDLLRKASENYPLKQTEDRWDEIASKISSVPVVKPARKMVLDKRYLFALLFLLTLLFVGLFILKPVKLNNIQPAFVHQKDSSQESNIRSITQLSSNTQKKITTNDHVTTENEKEYFNNENKKLKTRDSQNFFNKAISQIRIEQKTIMGRNNRNNDKQVYTFFNEDTLASKPNIPPYNNKPLAGKAFAFDTAQSVISSAENKEKRVTSSFSRKGFYYGLLAGPGFNSIKSQGLKKPGLNIGILGGYRFGKRISVETGLLFSQKYYTTAGKYFSMKEIGPAMPSAMTVMEVDGSTSVIEMPVHFRYDVFRNFKHSFFSSTGFSSYIITKESNQYHASLNGAEEMVYGTYKNAKRYFAASLDLAVGYEHNLGKKNKIRLQPYIKLPLKGIGVGDLQVMSIGLHTGITRFIK